ncbi:MAG: queuosine precursor transporter [Chloroflexi bacterium]|nr:queuosine precursor transporter [Chloroflexota bacterium]
MAGIPVLLVTASYIAAQMLSDIASLQIVQFAGLSFDAGTFIYPITFTLRDLAHKALGLKGVRVLIITAAVINLFMAGFFWFVSTLTPDTTAGSSDIWGRVLAPVWRITLASIAAEVIAELLDTEAYRIWVDRITHRYQWMRVLISNAVSVPVDSFIFSFLAFYGAMPASSVIGIFTANVIIKGVVTIVSLPMIYLVKEKPQ